MSKKRKQSNLSSTAAPSAGERAPSSDMDATTRATLRFGWSAVAVFMTGGLFLESLHLFKMPLYVEASLRRELWTLGHAHGTLLGVLTIALALTMRARRAGAPLVAASRALRASAVAMPCGFFLGGVGNAEGDPSLFILLVPLGALLAIFAATVTALELRRG